MGDITISKGVANTKHTLARQKYTKKFTLNLKIGALLYLNDVQD
jgi:hypothetical protein